MIVLPTGRSGSGDVGAVLPAIKFFKDAVEDILTGRKTLEPRPRSLSWIRRLEKVGQADKLLSELFWPGDGRETCVLLENHLSIVDQVGIRTFPHEDVRRYNAVGLVIVEASPGDVLERRRTDQQRNRYIYIGSLVEVVEQQQINRREAALIGRLVDIPITAVVS